MAGPEIRIIGSRDGRFEVASGDARYWVDPNRLRCSCPAGGRSLLCRHLRAVLAHLGRGASG